MIFGIIIYIASYYVIGNRIVEVAPPERVINSYARYTGVSYGDEGFTDVFSTIFAQTSLSYFIALTSMLSVYFLHPPHKFFAVWKEDVPEDKRIAWINLGLIAFLIFFYDQPYSSYFGLLPQPGNVSGGLVASAVVWMLCVRQLFKMKLFDRFFYVDS